MLVSRAVLRLALPPRGSLRPNSDVDPLKYYYAPLVGRIFAARINLGLRLLPAVRAERLLEVGFGSGLLLPTLARVARVVDGIDLCSEPDEVRAQVGAMGVGNLGELVRGDIRALPFSSGRYDVVVAFSILEHLRQGELPAALAEVVRVLGPGGRLLVGCPAVHKAMNLAFAAIGFHGIEQHHFSSIHDVVAAARAAGLSVERQATFPAPVPLGWAPYNAVLLRKPAGRSS